MRLRPYAVAFFVFGMFWGTWAVAAVDVERFLHASHAQFGLLLSAAIVAGALANALGGAMTERAGVGVTLQRALVVWAVLIAATALTTAGAVFAVLFVVTVGVGGAVDVAMNVGTAAVLASDPGRLMRFHGTFNAGAVAGALVAGGAEQAGWSWRVAWIVTAALALAAALAVARASEIRAAGVAGDGTRPPSGLRAVARALRSNRVAGLALVFACAALVEGGVETWGVFTLRAQLALGALAGAGAYVVGQSLATATRVGLGRVAGSRGSAHGAAIGAALAAAGLALEAAARQPALAAAGLVLAAVGVSCAWPLLLAHAASGPAGTGTVVGGITAAGYLGFVAGPPAVGWIANAWGLRAALLGLAAVAVIVATSPWHVARAATPSGA